MVRQVVRTPCLPWFSIDAESINENNIEYPKPKMDEVEMCMNCTREKCNDCLSSKKRRGNGRPVGRPRKSRTPIDGQISINTAAISAVS